MKKQLLFLIALIFAITPACTKQQRKLAGANGAIAAGTIATAGGLSLLFGGIFGTMAIFSCAFGNPIPVIAIALSSAGLISGGITGIVKGAHRRNRLIKKQKNLDQFKQDQEESGDLQYTPINEFTLERIESSKNNYSFSSH